jgi:enoyl-CoA hydratase/carnithine racemase
MSSSYEYLKISTDSDGVHVVMVSRPEKRNAYNEEMRVEMCQAFAAASRDPKVKVVILTAEGKTFIPGADLSGGKLGGESTNANVDVPAGRRADASTFRDGGGVAALAILRCTKPVIAAINGAAVGVGLTLPLSCDIRVAAHDTKVGFVFARRGLACESVSSWLLPRIVGMGKAMELVMTGRVFRTQDAPPGLFNYVVPQDQVLAKATELAREIALNTSGMSVSLSRMSLLRNQNLSPEEAHLAESKIIHWCLTKGESKEGFNSFLEKRPAKFTMDPYKDMPDFFPWWRQVDVSSKL